MKQSTDSLQQHQRQCTQQELKAISQFINTSLKGVQFLENKNYIPVEPMSDKLFQKLTDGQIIAYLLKSCDDKVINIQKLIIPKSKPLNLFQVKENVKYVLSCCKGAGMHLINIGVEDITNCREYLLASLIIQIIRLQAEMQLKLEINRNKQILEEMGIFSTGEVNSEKILLDFFQQCLKINKSKIQCKNLKDLSDYKIIAQALYAKLPMIFTVKDIKLDGLQLAKRICEVAQQINVPNVISPEELITPGSKLVFPFSVQLTVKLMQQAKIPEQILIKFINDMSELNENISSFDSFILPEAIYSIISAQTGKKSQEFEKARSDEDKEIQLFKYLYDTNTLQGNQNMDEIIQLPEHARKEILFQAIEKLYLNNVAPQDKMKEWIQNVLQLPKEQIDSLQLTENNDDLAIRLLSTLTTNPQLINDYRNAKSNDERRDILSQELKKQQIQFPYNSQQLIGSSSEIQYFLLNLIKNRFPIKSSGELNISDQTLIECMQSLIHYQSNHLQEVDTEQLLNDVEVLEKYVTDELGIKIDTSKHSKNQQKISQLIDVLSKQLKIQNTGETTLSVQEQKQHLKMLLTKVLQSKLLDEDIIFEFVNIKYNKNFYYKSMSTEELYFNYPIQLVDQKIYKDALEFYKKQKDSFFQDKQVVQKRVAQQLLDKIDLTYGQNNIQFSKPGIKFIMNQLISQLTPQDKFIIEQIEIIIQSPLQGFTQVDQLVKFFQIVNEQQDNSQTKLTDLIGKALYKVYKCPLSQSLQTHLSQNLESKLFKLFLSDCLDAYYQGLYQYIKLNGANAIKQLKAELGSDQNKYKQFQDLISSTPSQFNEYKNLLGLILLQDDYIIRQLSIKPSILSTQITTSTYSKNELQNIQNYYQIYNKFTSKSSRTPPYSMDNVAKQPFIVFSHYLYSIQNLCLKCDQYYIQLLNYYCKETGIQISKVDQITQLKESDYVTLFNTLFPNIGSENKSGEQGLKYYLQLGSSHDSFMQFNEADLTNKKYNQLPKMFLNQIFKDKMQQIISQHTFLDDQQLQLYLDSIIVPGSSTQIHKIAHQVNQLLNERNMQQINMQGLSNDEIALQLNQKLQQLNLIESQLDSTLISQMDQQILQQIQTGIMKQSLIPQDILLKDINTYASVFDNAAFANTAGLDNNTLFQQIYDEFKKLQIPFPYKTQEQLKNSSELLNQSVLSQLYIKKVLEKQQDIQDAITQKLLENHVQTVEFDGNKRGQKINISDKSTFGLETFMQSVIQFVPNLQHQLEQILQNDQFNQVVKVQKTLDVLSQNNIIYDHFKPQEILNNDATQLTLLFNQLIELNKKQGRSSQDANYLSSETIEQCIRIYLKNQYRNIQVRNNKQYENLFKKGGFENNGEGKGFTIKTLADPSTFILVYNLLTNDYIALDNVEQTAKDEDVFEQVLQQLQYKGYQTQFCKDTDMINCQGKQYLMLMTEILKPRQLKMKQLIQEFNKYLKGGSQGKVLVNFEDLQTEETFTTIYSAMYSSYTPKDKVKFFVELKVPMELIKWMDIQSNSILNLICQIPYDNINDYIYYDEQTMLQWMVDMKICNKISAIKDVSLKELSQLVDFIAIDSCDSKQSDYDKIRQILSQNQIPLVFNSQNELLNESKIKMVVINQIKYYQQLSFKLLQKIYNNLGQIYGFPQQLIDHSDLSKPSMYIQLFMIQSSTVEFYNKYSKSSQQQQQDALAEQTQKLKICTPISMSHLFRNKKLQLIYCLDIIGTLIQDQDLISYCNLLFQLKSKTELIKQIVDIADSQKMLLFLQSNNLNKYQNITSKIQVDELVQLIQSDEDYVCKLNNQHFTKKNHYVFKKFLLEQYHNQVNIQHLPILKEDYINMFLEENGVTIKNLNIKQNDSKQLIKLIKKLDTQYQHVETQDQLFSKLSQEFPQMDIVFMLNDQENINKYNIIALSQIYMKYKVLNNIKLVSSEELIKWVNSCLKHQSSSQIAKITNLSALHDGIVIANLLALIQEDQAVISEFESKKAQNDHLKFIIQVSERNNLTIQCLQESDFINCNESAFQIFLSQLYCDIDQILDSCMYEKQLIISWLHDQSIQLKYDEISLETFNQKVDQMLKLANILYQQKFEHVSELLNYVTSENGFIMKYTLTPDHFEKHYNHAAIQLIFDTICNKDLIPLKHLVTFLNVKFSDGQKLQSLKTSNVQIFSILLQFMKQLKLSEQIPLDLTSLSQDQKKRLLSEVSMELNLSHLIDDSVLKKSSNGDLYLLTNNLYKRQIKSVPEYANWVNGILARARKPELFLKSTKISESVLNCIFSYYYPQTYSKILDKQENWGYKLSANAEINKFMSFLKQQFDVDYVVEKDVTNNSERLLLMLDLIMTDKKDFSQQQLLPENFMKQILHLKHPYKEQIQIQDALEPQNIILSFYGLAATYIPKLQNLSSCHSFDEQALLFLTTMKSYDSKLSIKLQEIDWYEYGYNKDAAKYTASECLCQILSKNDPLSNSTAYINDLMAEEADYIDQISSLSSLQDVQALLKLLGHTYLYKHLSHQNISSNIEQMDKKQCFDTLITIVQQIEHPNDVNQIIVDIVKNLEESDLKHEWVVSLIIDAVISATKPKILNVDDIQEILKQYFKEELPSYLPEVLIKDPESMKFILTELCKRKEGQQAVTKQDIDKCIANIQQLDENNVVTIAKKVLKQLGDTINLQLWDPHLSNEEAATQIFSCISTHLVPQNDIDGLLNEFVTSVWGNNDYNINTQTMCQNKQTALCILQLLTEQKGEDVQGLTPEQVDQKLSLLLKKMEINQFCDLDNINDPQIMKVVLNQAFEIRNKQKVDENILEKIYQNNELLKQKQLYANNVNPISLAQVQHVCPLALILNRIDPQLLSNHVIYNRTQAVHNQDKVDHINVLSNYNACQEIISTQLSVELDGLSGSDLQDYDKFYYTWINEQLATREIYRVETLLQQSVQQHLELKYQLQTNNAETLQKLLEILVPDLPNKIQRKEKDEQLNILLDYIRGAGILHVITPKQFRQSGVLRSYIAALLLEAIQQQSA